MELFQEDSSTKLRLTHTVIENFEDNIPEFTRESGLQGWTYFIKESLVNFLDKTSEQSSILFSFFALDGNQIFAEKVGLEACLYTTKYQFTDQIITLELSVYPK